MAKGTKLFHRDLFSLFCSPAIPFKTFEAGSNENEIISLPITVESHLQRASFSSMSMMTFKANFKFITNQETPSLLLFSSCIIAHTITSCKGFNFQIWHWGPSDSLVLSKVQPVYTVSRLLMCLQWLSDSSNSHDPPQNEISQNGCNFCCPAGYTLHQALKNAVFLGLVLYLFMTEAQTLGENTVHDLWLTSTTASFDA